MKLSIKNILVAATLSLSLCAAAQNTKSGYFLEDYTYRFQLNPAYANSTNFVSMPGLANFNFGVNGNLGLSDVLYNVNGRTTTFLNPNVPTSTVLSNINDVNRFDINMKMTVLGGGFKAFGGYNTVTINACTNVGIKLPGTLFTFLKEGIANETYNIGNIKANALGYGEIAFGHSRQITEEIRVGASVKILMGVARANVNFEKADLSLGVNDWRITTQGDVNVNMKGFKFEQKTGDDSKYIGNPKVDGTGIGGFGLGLDLGAVWKPASLKDFEFSIALRDIGFISWSNNILASTNGEKTFNTDKYTFNADDDATNSFSNEVDKIKDDIKTIYQLENMGNTGGKTSGLGATFNAGVLYTLPYYNKLKFGLLNTTHVQGDFSWTDFRLSANVMPCKIFDAGINLAAGTYGVGFGWLANLHCTGFNLFVGMDHTLGKLAKQGIPLNSNAQFNFGMNFLF